MASVHTCFADSVAKLCYDHYYNLPKTGKPQIPKEWTLLAAILTSRSHEESLIPDAKDPPASSLKVVSLATGSKCIGQSQMRKNGSVLNDSHAEVLARRAFLRYLYEQMSLVLQGAGSPVLEYRDADDFFRIADGVQFHLFTSAVPCGDASIFPAPFERREDRPPCKRLKREEDCTEDIHRTGAKCLENSSIADSWQPGVDYHVVGVPRTKPGRGDRTLSMSCSDKMAKWNAVGIQGALLAQLLSRPLYLSTITIGKCLYSEAALRRAVIDRLDRIQDLPEPYAKASPRLFQSSLEFAHSKAAVERESSSASPAPSAIIWSDISTRSLEVAVNGFRQGSTAKDRSSGKARCAVSKYELFKTYADLLRRLPRPSQDSGPKTYRDCKKAPSAYTAARDVVCSALGAWTQKPGDLTDFLLEG